MEVISDRIQIVARIGINHLFKENSLLDQGLRQQPGLGEGHDPVLRAVEQHQGVVCQRPHVPVHRILGETLVN